MESPCWLSEVSRESGQEIHLVSPVDDGNGGHSPASRSPRIPGWEATDRLTVETEEQEGV